MAMEEKQTCLVKVQEFSDTGRGLGCTKKVSKGDVLLSVPFRECWTKITASICPDLLPVTKLPKLKESVKEHDLICMHIMIEVAKEEESSRYQHLTECPKTFDLPMFWDDDELDELRGSGYHTIACRTVEQVEGDYKALCRMLRQHMGRIPAAEFVTDHSFSLDRYKWATAVMYSRCCDVKIAGKMSRLLAPQFDMFNHCTNQNQAAAHAFEATTKSLMVVANTEQEEGSQVFISYGNLPNQKQLLWYGFVQADNPLDSVDLFLSLEPIEIEQNLNNQKSGATKKEEKIWREKHARLVAHGCERYIPDTYLPGQDQALSRVQASVTEEFVVRHQLRANNPLPSSLPAMMRLMNCSTMEEIDVLGKTLEKRLPIEKETAMLRDLESILSNMMDVYPDSIQDDIKLQQAEELPYRLRLALTVRLSEKQIIAAAIDRVKEEQSEAANPATYANPANTVTTKASGSKKNNRKKKKK